MSRCRKQRWTCPCIHRRNPLISVMSTSRTRGTKEEKSRSRLVCLLHNPTSILRTWKIKKLNDFFHEEASARHERAKQREEEERRVREEERMKKKMFSGRMQPPPEPQRKRRKGRHQSMRPSDPLPEGNKTTTFGVISRTKRQKILDYPPMGPPIGHYRPKFEAITAH